MERSFFKPVKVDLHTPPTTCYLHATFLNTEPVFLNFEGDQRSIPGGPVRQP